VPEELAQLTTLRVLALGNNQLAAVPAELGQLTHLRELNLHEKLLNQRAKGIRAPDQLAEAHALCKPVSQRTS
jgi:hypothetical protein